MMKRMMAIVAVAGLLMGALQTQAADTTAQAKLKARLAGAQAALIEIMATPDQSIPSGILAGAECVAVVPHYKKGAFILGGQYGQGVATCRTAHGWSAPVFISLEGGSFGWQIGGQSTDLVLVAMNHDGLQQMLKNKFKIGGDAAASAGPVGRNTQAGTDWKLNAEFLTWSRSKGLFAGIDLDGTVMAQNQDDTRAFYGADIPFGTVLAGETACPEGGRAFVQTVAKYFVAAKAKANAKR